MNSHMNELIILSKSDVFFWSISQMFSYLSVISTLQLAHGADPSMKNQEGQTPLDLATAEDVRALLVDAMPHATTTQTVQSVSAATVPMSRPMMTTLRPVTSGLAAPVPDKAATGTQSNPGTTVPLSTVTGPSTANPLPPAPAAATVAVPAHPKPPSSIVPLSGTVAGGSQTGDGAADVGGVDKQTPELLLMVTNPMDISVGAFLRSIQLDHLRDVFDKEQVSCQVLVEM